MIINNDYIKSDLVKRMHFISPSHRDHYAKIFFTCDSCIEVECTKEEFLSAIRELEKKGAANGKDSD